MDLQSIQSIIDTGGSIVCLCGIVYCFLRYLRSREKDEQEAREKERETYEKSLSEEREMRFKEHELHCKEHETHIKQIIKLTSRNGLMDFDPSDE